MKDKWVSISNHVVDIHEGHGGSFPCCEHDPLGAKAWIKKGTVHTYIHMPTMQIVTYSKLTHVNQSLPFEGGSWGWGVMVEEG